MHAPARHITLAGRGHVCPLAADCHSHVQIMCLTDKLMGI